MFYIIKRNIKLKLYINIINNWILLIYKIYLKILVYKLIKTLFFFKNNFLNYLYINKFWDFKKI